MSIPISCPQCGKTYNVSDDRAGQTGKCQCGTGIPIPLQTQPTAAGPEVGAVQPPIHAPYVQPQSSIAKCPACGDPLLPGTTTCPKCVRTLPPNYGAPTVPAYAPPPVYGPPPQAGQATPPAYGNPPPAGQVPYGYAGGQGAPNTSGQGAMAHTPDELRGWSWGGFLLGWIWAIGMQTWIGLLCLVPYLGVVMFIVLGVKGNEWAWQNRKWDSIQQFREVQSIWTKWGVALIIAGVVLGIVFAIVGGMSQFQQ